MQTQNTNDLRSFYTDAGVVEQYLERRFASPTGRFHHLSEQRLVRGYLSSVERVVELACGPARFGALAHRLRWRYLGLDISMPMLHQAHRRWPDLALAQADAFALPLADQAADAVLTLRFLRHLTYPNRRQAYEEIYRVLRPGGRLVFDACNETRHRPLIHRRTIYDELYTDSRLREELEAHNFRLLKLSGYLYQDKLIRYLRGATRRFWAWGWTLPLRWTYALQYRYERTLSQSSKDAYLWLVLCQKRTS